MSACMQFCSTCTCLHIPSPIPVVFWETTPNTLFNIDSYTQCNRPGLQPFTMLNMGTSNQRWNSPNHEQSCSMYMQTLSWISKNIFWKLSLILCLSWIWQKCLGKINDYSNKKRMVKTIMIKLMIMTIMDVWVNYFIHFIIFIHS